MDIQNGEIVIETRLDAKTYIDQRMQEILDLRDDIAAIQATIDSKIQELQSVQELSEYTE